jgi:hypothetical protein
VQECIKTHGKPSVEKIHHYGDESVFANRVSARQVRLIVPAAWVAARFPFAESATVEFAGKFETHITVPIEESVRIDALRAWAESRHLRFHHIVLDRGATPSQPMVSRRGHGTLSGERAAVAELVRQLNTDGFAVSRVKIEAAPENRDVPTTDAEAAERHASRYFEHHVKLLLTPSANLADLARLAQEYGAHLSRNARRVRGDGLHERFVTQRCYSVGRLAARERLDALRAAVVAGGYAIEAVEAEFVVYDSAPAVDAGWLEPGGAV